MKEQQPRPEARLLPVTQELLQEIHQLTGMAVSIRPEPALHGQARAVYIAADPSAEQHRVLYDPQYERHLDHLVAHECGHIVRLAAASRADRVIPVMTSSLRYDMTLQLLPDIERLLNRGILDEGALAVVLPLWLGGIVSQLHNTPADIHIERWLHRELPALREAQFASIASEARDAYQALGTIRDFTPRRIWLGSNAMNYALLKASADLFDRPELVQPYQGTGVQRTGRRLLALVNAEEDRGFACDRRLSDRWSEELGFKGWLQWRRIDDLPAEHWHMWEHDHGDTTITRDVGEGGRP